MAFGISDTYTKGSGNEPVKVNKVEPTDPKPQEEIVEKPQASIASEPKPNIEPEKPIDSPIDNKKPSEEPKPLDTPQFTKEQVEGYLKSNYFKDKEFNGIDDLLKSQELTVKEVVKEVNPYEDIIDDYDKKYFEFKKDTGLGRKEFDFVQQDLSSKSPLDLAIQKIKSDSGLALSDSDAKSYLERKLSIDLSDNDLSVEDKIELNNFVKPFKDKIVEQQEKYKSTIATPKEKGQPQEPLFVTQDGRTVTKDVYEQEIKQVKLDYINNIKSGVNSVTSADYNVEIDDNGAKREINFKYNFSEEDKHSMLSDASDIDAMINKRYSTDKGFSHAKLAKGLWFGNKDNQEKIIKAAMQQARASLLEEIAASDNNENFNRKPITPQAKNNDGYGDMREAVTRRNSSGFGLQY
ncbi:hypothetical protein [Olleya marilimosa]|uniref:hypothetical protein n=1 Tax=Olleya marilimosa TaxID=272164 RepID=UPI0030ED3CD2|tara:strand:+ start:4931 stop:6151 length:1221 start_codon:yes stop_codon:yes gene_type:complete